MRTTLFHAALLAGFVAASPALAVDLPADATPEETAAYAALETSCAGCHQEGRLAGMPEPMAGFGNVLDLRGMAAEGKYVLPGNPDGSVLAIFASGTGHPIASLDEDGLAALRAWIASLE